MIRILQRMIFWEVAGATLGAVSIFVFALLVGNALRDVIGLLAEGTLPFTFFLRMIGLLIPYVMAYALPLGCLTGILIALGRLSSNREIIAMKASGMSLWRISFPILSFAVFGAVLSAWFNAYYGPQSRTEYRENLANLVRHNPLAFLRPQTFIRDFPGLILYAESERNGVLQGLWIWQLDEDRNSNALLRANEAGVSLDTASDTLVLSLSEGSLETRSRNTGTAATATMPTLQFDSWTVRLDLEEVLGRIGARRKLSMYSLPELQVMRRELLAREGKGDEHAFAERIAIQTQIQQHFAMAYSVIAMAFLAIPLGIRLSRAETLSNVVLALAIALSYYFFVIAFGWFERLPHWRPDLLVWIPNIILQAIGLTFFIRASRH